MNFIVFERQIDMNRQINASETHIIKQIDRQIDEYINASDMGYCQIDRQIDEYINASDMGYYQMDRQIDRQIDSQMDI